MFPSTKHGLSKQDFYSGLSVPVNKALKDIFTPLGLSEQSGHGVMLNNEDEIDVGIDLVVYVMKKQLFLDGNTRPPFRFTDHYLISHALGLTVVPADKDDEYKKVLVLYYENELMKPDIANFLKEKCWIKME